VARRGIAQPSVAGNVVSTGGGEFRWGAYLSTKDFIDDAIAEAVERILQSIGSDSEPELALVFVSSAYGSQYERIVPTLRELVPSLKCIYGSSVRRRPPPPPPAAPGGPAAARARAGSFIPAGIRGGLARLPPPPAAPAPTLAARRRRRGTAWWA
jgi:hypothetical protein